jgi:hypothetical protein
MISDVRVRDRYRLPLREVSGLGSRRPPDSDIDELLAIGDDQSAVAVARLSDGTLEIDHRPLSVHGLPLHGGPSQWEAVAGDATGRVLVIREKGSRLLVFSANLSLEADLPLTHPWAGDDRWGLESLLLMQHGHFLSAKQKKPVRLIEFAPRDEAPLGLAADKFLTPDEAFDISADRDQYVSVREWQLDNDDDLASINDLAHDGRKLLALSATARQVVQLEQSPERALVAVRRRWSLRRELRGGADARIEGLLAHPHLGAYVAVDTHAQHAENLLQIVDGWAQN